MNCIFCHKYFYYDHETIHLLECQSCQATYAYNINLKGYGYLRLKYQSISIAIYPFNDFMEYRFNNRVIKYGNLAFCNPQLVQDFYNKINNLAAFL